jgi:Tfp pilus assembly protein PilO
MTRTRKWSLLTALVVVVVMLAGWFLVVSPTRSSADQAREQAAAQETKNDQLKAQIADLQAKKKNLPQQQAIIAQVQQQIPSNPELPSLIRSISSMATSAGVDVHTLTPVNPVASAAQQPANAVGVNGQTLQTINVEMEVLGTYANVERFLNKMESLKRSLLVTGLTLNIASGSGTTGGSTVVAAQAGVSPSLAATISFRAFMVSSSAAPGTSPLHTTTPTTGTSSTGTTGGTSSTTSSSTAQ